MLAKLFLVTIKSLLYNENTRILWFENKDFVCIKKLSQATYVALTNKFIMVHNVSSLQKQGINVFLFFLYFFLILLIPTNPLFLSAKWVRSKDNYPGLFRFVRKRKDIYEMVSRWKYIMEKIATLVFKRENI